MAEGGEKRMERNGDTRHTHAPPTHTWREGADEAMRAARLAVGAKAAVRGAGETCACVRAAAEGTTGADVESGGDAAEEAVADLRVVAGAAAALPAVEVGALAVLVFLLV